MYEQLIKDLQDYNREMGFIVGTSVDALAAVEKLKEYTDAEEQGRLVILPCKVGDTLFLAQVGREEPFSMRVQGMSISASGNDVILHFGGFPIANAWGSEVGKTLFLTREEAEAALKGEREDV